MSFELSPEAVIFSLRTRLAQIEEQIIGLGNQFVELPLPRFRTIEVRNNQGFFDGRTTQKLIFNPNLAGLQRGNGEISVKINQLNAEKTSIENQIPIIEVDIQAKGIKGFIQNPNINLTGIEEQLRDLGNQLSSFEFPQAQEQTTVIKKQDNTVRNALLIGGALLIL